MNALATCRAYYQGRDDLLFDDLIFYGSTGLAHLSPSFCLLARPVSAGWTDEQIIGRHLAHKEDLTHTCFLVHIHLATGDLAEIRACLLAHFGNAAAVSYQRRGGRLRRIPADLLTRTTAPHGILATKAAPARPRHQNGAGQNHPHRRAGFPSRRVLDRQNPPRP